VPKGVYDHARRKPAVHAMAAPLMPSPPHGRRWLASTQRSWASWWESGRAGLLDVAGVEELKRLVRMHDDAERAGWPADLHGQVRILETRLLTTIAPKALSVAEIQKREVQAEILAEHRAERREVLAAERDACAEAGVELASYELSALMQPQPEWAERARTLIRRRGVNPDLRVQVTN
jgi:hypothetical protein